MLHSMKKEALVVVLVVLALPILVFAQATNPKIIDGYAVVSNTDQAVPIVGTSPLAGGEAALRSRWVGITDPPPTVRWGPFTMSDLHGLGWGLYGLDYDGYEDRLNAVYFWQDRVRFYRSADSSNTARPETAYVTYVPGPVRDSFQDFSSCRYDHSIWTHSSKLKKVFKLDAGSGAILDSFRSPATEYPTGIAFDERNKELYLVDRKYEGNGPAALYVTDTLGNVKRQYSLGQLGYSYAGARCLDMDYTNTNPNWPSLLLMYSYFSSSGTLDSCVLFELDRLNPAGTPLHRASLPTFYGDIPNARGISWDPRTSDYWVSIMQEVASPSHNNSIYKMDGWYQPAYPDVGVTTIQAPRGVAALNTGITPRAMVRNFDTIALNVPVRMKIGSSYANTANFNIGASREIIVTFPTWTAASPGRYTVQCSTMLSGDCFALNDVFYDTIWITAHDVGCTRIIVPTGTEDSGTSVVPACSVYNFGTFTESYAVRMKIGGLYNNPAPVTNLGPGNAGYVTFPAWPPLARGMVPVTCSTELGTDVVPTNDKEADSVLVSVLDAEALSIIAPDGYVDSGSTVTPQAQVRNDGNTTVSFNARLDIGPAYSSFQPVNNLAPGTTQTVTFDDWLANRSGILAVRCTVLLAGDIVPPNNVVTSSVEVRVLDARAVSIIAPSGTVDSGVAITPRATVKNNGTATITFDVLFTIGDWTGTQSVTLLPDSSALVGFLPWTAASRGTFATKCSTCLTGDARNANDFVTGSVDVRVHDAGTVAILAPSDTVDPAWRTVSARVMNFGSVTETFDVKFQIFNSTGTEVYSNTQTETGLAAGASMDVVFDDWTGTHALDNYTTRCSTRLAGDAVEANDALDGSLVVSSGSVDVGAISILAPTGIIDTITPVNPGCRVHNYGSLPATFGARFRILDPVGTEVYRVDTLNVLLAAGGQSDLVFPAWTGLRDTGDYAARCSVMLGDANASNDVATGGFHVAGNRVLFHDVSTERIVTPHGVVDTAPKTPQAEVRNRGDATETFDVRFRIFDLLGTELYTGDATASTLAPDTSVILDFPDWTGHHDIGTYYVRCSTMLADANPGNDVQTDSFRIQMHVLPPGWHRMADIPIGPKGKRVKDGGALAYAPANDSEAWLYAFKGNNTAEFFKYNVQTSNWATKESIPVIGSTGKKKKIKKGATLAYASRSADSSGLYATKGNNTLDFWMFTPTSDSQHPIPNPYAWVEKAFVPPGARRVKDGTSVSTVSFHDSTWIYLLKGAGTTEFYRYNLSTGQWEQMAFAPSGYSGRPYKSGSCITWDGANIIYCLKANYNEFYAYRVDSNKWLPAKASLPLIGSSGRKKKVKDGAGLAYDGGLVYALKGNNTQEFWSYNADSNRWIQKEDIPIGGGKKVKGGGTLISGDVWGQPVLWALKGNNTFEFWQYVPSFTATGSTPGARGSVQTQSTIRNPRFAMAIAPNPFSTATTIAYTLPEPGNISLKLYDVTGKLVSTLADGYRNAGASSFTLHSSSLSCGIYLLRLELDSGLSLSQKVIIK